MDVTVVVLSPIWRHTADDADHLLKPLRERFRNYGLNAHGGTFGKIGLRRQNDYSSRNPAPVGHAFGVLGPYSTRISHATWMADKTCYDFSGVRANNAGRSREVKR